MLGHRLMGCTARGFPSRWIQLRMSLVPAPAATAPPAATGTRRASLAFGSVQGAPVTLQHMAIQPVLCLTGIAAGLLSRAWSTEEVKRCTDHIQVHLDVHCTHVYYYDIQYSLFSMFRNQGENFGKHRGSCSHTCSTIITDRGLACVIISDLVPFLSIDSYEDLNYKKLLWTDVFGPEGIFGSKKTQNNKNTAFGVEQKHDNSLSTVRKSAHDILQRLQFICDFLWKKKNDL